MADARDSRYRTRLLGALSEAMRDVPAGEELVAAGVKTYLTSLESRPGQVRTLTLEILHLGPRGLSTRRRAMRRFAELVLREIDAVDSGAEHSDAIAVALVGGVNELVLEAIEEDRVETLGQRSEAVTALFRPFSTGS